MLVIYTKHRYYIYVLSFEWNEDKNKGNRKKHGVWFEEAIQVFDDPMAVVYRDSAHSTGEERFIILGHSASSRVLVVVYCERAAESIIRVISARRATKKEIRNYEEGI